MTALEEEPGGFRTINRGYKLVAVSKLHPHPQNPNIGDGAVIAESVEINGFYGAVTVRAHPDLPGEFQILAGEHRWKTAMDAGADKVPCILVEPDDDVAAARIMLVDNESAKRSTYDPVKLTDTLAYVGDTKGTAFDLAGLSDFEDERRAAEAQNDDEDEADFVREYGVIVVVADEAEQKDLYEEFRERGLSVRVASI